MLGVSIPMWSYMGSVSVVAETSKNILFIAHHDQTGGCPRTLYRRQLSTVSPTKVLPVMNNFGSFPKLGYPKIDPQNTIVVSIGTPKKGTPNFGKPLFVPRSLCGNKGLWF